MNDLQFKKPLLYHRSYHLSCGVPALGIEIAKGLEKSGWELNDQSEIGLLIDAPLGFALQTLIRESPRVWLVVTDNPCPEYWEDLWSLSPQVLLAGGHSALNVVNALDRTISGESFRQTPHYDNPLTHIERQLLQYSAQGWGNKRIAQKINLTEGTVKNGLSRVFQKLNLENRTQLALYYWGLWHLLDSRLSGDKSLAK